MSLSKRLKLLRIEFQMTQEELASLLQVSIDRIRNIESGKVKKIYNEEVLKLEETYNIDPLWISTGKGYMIKGSTYIGVHGVNNGNVHFGDKNYPHEIVEIAEYLYNNIPPAKYSKIMQLIKEWKEYTD